MGDKKPATETVAGFLCRPVLPEIRMRNFVRNPDCDVVHEMPMRDILDGLNLVFGGVLEIHARGHHVRRIDNRDVGVVRAVAAAGYFHVPAWKFDDAG